MKNSKIVKNSINSKKSRRKVLIKLKKSREKVGTEMKKKLRKKKEKSCNT